MSYNRRAFLKNSGIALASFGVIGGAPSFMQRAVFGQTKTGKRKTLIAIFQRGAVDGLNMIVPYGDGDYYNYRPTIAVAKPLAKGLITNPNSLTAAVDLDGYFGLHPSLAALQKLFADKRMAIVHAVGSPDATRSHFDAQDYMESGTPGVKSTPDGWLNRAMQGADPEGHSLFRAVAMTNSLPRALWGKREALAISNLNDFTIRAGAQSARVQGGFEALYDDTVKDDLSNTGRETFEAVNYLKRVNPARHTPTNGAVYPRGRFGESLMQIAQLVKSDVGLEIAFAETGGWDTHINQGAGQGALANRLAEFGQGISALVVDLGARMDDVVILTMSEFGRTARENGTRGTDHGHANAMLVIGNSVKGGKVLGEWKGLRESNLYEGRDLALTTDFRDVFGEVAARHLKVKDLKNVFPGYESTAQKWRDVIG